MTVKELCDYLSEVPGHFAVLVNDGTTIEELVDIYTNVELESVVIDIIPEGFKSTISKV